MQFLLSALIVSFRIMKPMTSVHVASHTEWSVTSFSNYRSIFNRSNIFGLRNRSIGCLSASRYSTCSWPIAAAANPRLTSADCDQLTFNRPPLASAPDSKNDVSYWPVAVTRYIDVININNATRMRFSYVTCHTRCELRCVPMQPLDQSIVDRRQAVAHRVPTALT